MSLVPEAMLLVHGRMPLVPGAMPLVPGAMPLVPGAMPLEPGTVPLEPGTMSRDLISQAYGLRGPEAMPLYAIYQTFSLSGGRLKACDSGTRALPLVARRPLSPPP
jgi:hypothetical protein